MNIAAMGQAQPSPQSPQEPAVRIANGRLYVDFPPGPAGITVSWK